MLPFSRFNHNRVCFSIAVNVNDGYSEVLWLHIAIDKFLALLFIVINDMKGD